LEFSDLLQEMPYEEDVTTSAENKRMPTSNSATTEAAESYSPATTNTTSEPNLLTKMSEISEPSTRDFLKNVTAELTNMTSLNVTVTDVGSKYPASTTLGG
jgi:hypothetical protein